MHNKHIGPSQDDIDHMLKSLGYSSLDNLMDAALPDDIKSSTNIQITPHDEHTTLAYLKIYAQRNRVKTSMLGQGFYNCITPAVIRRNILQNPSWYTSYTPYQPEISQGRLEMLINFQTMICDLTGLEIANASMLDEGSCAAEAMFLARRMSKSPSNRYLVHEGVFSHIRRVLHTRAEAVDIEIVEVSEPPIEVRDYFGVYVQYQSASGQLLDLQRFIGEAKRTGAISVIGCDLLMLTLFASPGELGADIAIGSAQRFGTPMNFGGPSASFLATRKTMQRALPGRLVGVSIDADSKPAYRLTLQTREQHIRREKATSNICTATVLCAIASACFAQHHGPDGLRAIAERVQSVTLGFAQLLMKVGFTVSHLNSFDTIEIKGENIAYLIIKAESQHDLLFWKVDNNTLRMVFDEVTSKLDQALQIKLSKIFGVSLEEIQKIADMSTKDATRKSVAHDKSSIQTLPHYPLMRSSKYLQHPVFTDYKSEVTLTRYLKRLADKDFALDRGMIPLGSCTMKLNAAFQMEPISWPEFANLHPFAPQQDTQGTLEIITQIEQWLASLSGYDAASLQPTAGSQGELAGLLAIRGYYKSIRSNRNICLIPESAHGTNAASAVLAGMQVVVVACDRNGNIDFEDLKQKASTHAQSLACLMVTYPSTHGVYEENIREICSVIHQYGGQVYIDGANSNALIGYVRTGDFGGDISHLNLHKTFAIPHGGGGPGIGPVVAKAHLAAFLPSKHSFPDSHTNTEKNAFLKSPQTPFTDSQSIASTNTELQSHTPHAISFVQRTPSGTGTPTAIHNPESNFTSEVAHSCGPIASTGYGFAGALYISWAYIFSLGTEGMRRSTAVAVLNANYMAQQLSKIFPILYTGKNHLVAHEFILDLRSITKTSGITADDICKRLIDYGFHAPTMSFPVSGTLMVEPTESEPFFEITRFIDAMRSIRDEIDKVIDGTYDRENNPLKRAPHTLLQITSDDWDRPYSRHTAVVYTADKYWPGSARIDNAYGDRNVFCTCPDISSNFEISDNEK